MGRSTTHGPGKALLQWSGTRETPGLTLQRRAGRVWPLRQRRELPAGPEAKRALRVRAQHLGERVAMAFLRDSGDTDVARLGGTAIPFDVLSRQHAVEVKTGLVTNEGNSAQWRCSLSAAKGAEKAVLDELDDDVKSMLMSVKREQMMARKRAALREVQRVMPVVPITIGLIVDLEEPAVDVFWFGDWHLRLGWTSTEATTAYQGTFTILEDGV